MVKSHEFNFKTTAEIKVPEDITEQIIGQDEAVNIIKKAAKQRRNVLLIGSPGTGKSLLGQGLATLLGKEKLVDVLAYPNLQDENVPLIKVVSKGKGRDLVAKARIQATTSFKNQSTIIIIIAIISSVIPYFLWKTGKISDIIYAASMITSIIFIIGLILFLNLGKRIKSTSVVIPKLLIDNAEKSQAPFIDASGAHAGALLGDCLHDPLQSGGLGTPAHERLITGSIHRSNGGVLYIDEIGTLDPHSQQELLTAMQEKKYPITGQSERSSGSMVRSEYLPTDFILIAAGNYHTIERMHPALRSRIRGYGYEVYVNDTMPDTPQNRFKIAQFVAQEVKKDKKIPHFTKEAVEVIITESRKRAGIAGKLTLRLRELGGLVRAAGDLALEQGFKYVLPTHVNKAKQLARTLEQQIADKYIENKKKYEVILTEGKLIGRVNGLAVLGSENHFSGIVLPIESEVTPGGKKSEIVATGQLGKIAKEAVKNVSAIILKHFGEDIKEKYDIYTQFLYTASSGVEGDSASIAVATSIISALTKVPVKQDFSMTGSLSVRGDVLAVGGVTQKIEAAIEAGIKNVLVPKSNFQDVMLFEEQLKMIKIHPVSTIEEVLNLALEWKGKETIYKKFTKKI
ncbi:ATP-dependent protease LonB [Candidatus Woesearchaeota archaeon]|nr:ATP-dependent protease LonB [Candidatus Woesearchaeota archaeon]